MENAANNEIKVYQFILSDEEVDLVNEKGWGANDRIKAYADRSFKKDPAFFEDNFNQYNHVANVQADDLEDAFRLMNVWDDLGRVSRVAAEVMSMSVGDILEKDGEFYFCASIGFKKLDSNNIPEL